VGIVFFFCYPEIGRKVTHPTPEKMSTSYIYGKKTEHTLFPEYAPF
jgi:hypothetical protein